MKVYGGAPLYGESIGILLLDGGIPRIPGDIGNALTFPFPVRYKVVCNVEFHNVNDGLTPEQVAKFCEAAQELEHEGCRAITTSCGFLGAYQQEIAASVNIPVFTSSLMQARWVSSMLPAGKKVCILASGKGNLTTRLLKGLGIEDLPLYVLGLDGSPSFASMHGENLLDPEILRKECLNAVKEVDGRSDIGAVVVECTNLPPYSADIQEATHLPVFDINTMVHYLYHAVTQMRYLQPKQWL